MLLIIRYLLYLRSTSGFRIMKHSKRSYQWHPISSHNIAKIFNKRFYKKKKKTRSRIWKHMINENTRLLTRCPIACPNKAIWFHESEEELPKTGIYRIIESERPKAPQSWFRTASCFYGWENRGHSAKSPFLVPKRRPTVTSTIAFRSTRGCWGSGYRRSPFGDKRHKDMLKICDTQHRRSQARKARFGDIILLRLPTSKASRRSTWQGEQ